jgi:hypothetical protein
MASALRLGSVLTLRITFNRAASAASSNAVPPANARATRSPKCSPNQPPNSAPGPAGSRINQRMVLVIRPSIGAGVTDCRSDKKLMNMNTAPMPKHSSIIA